MSGASGATYPISRWYVGPLAERVAGVLARTFVRPAHLTLSGLASAMAAGAILVFRPEAASWAAALVLLAWFFDRADGLLARRQGTASAWGAWLDANVDELVDVGLHAAVASAAATLSGSSVPWWLFGAFLAGKYLFMYGLSTEPAATPPAAVEVASNCDGRARRLARRLWHLPGMADVRLHLLVLALLSGWLTAELALVAAYYNLRWTGRYLLVWRRLGGLAP